MIIKEGLASHDVLKRIFGFDSFKGNQEVIIENLLSGKDTFVIMPTGGGKSMCYQLPALSNYSHFRSYPHLKYSCLPKGFWQFAPAVSC